MVNAQEPSPRQHNMVNGGPLFYGVRNSRLKVTSASQHFKRLILKYRDDLEFRQAIEKQLNKVEGSNKFSKAISFGHNQEFI